MTTSAEAAFDLEQAAREFFAEELVDVVLASGVFVDMGDLARVVRHGIRALGEHSLLGEAVDLWYQLNREYMEAAGVDIELTILEGVAMAAHLCAPEDSDA